MSIYAIVESNTVTQYGSLAVLFPHISFPASGPTEEWKQQNSVFKVLDKKDLVDLNTKLKAVPPYFEKGAVYSVEVINKTPEELANERHNIIADAIATENRAVLASLSPDEKDSYSILMQQSIRADRNKRLADCDWTQLPDAPVDATVWATYRQALRDITSQSGFPWDVQWPEEPST